MKEQITALHWPGGGTVMRVTTPDDPEYERLVTLMGVGFPMQDMFPDDAPPKGKVVSPPPRPPGGIQWTAGDWDELAKAKIKALKRQWPRSFKIFECGNRGEITEEEREYAYLWDCAENGGRPFLELEIGQAHKAISMVLGALTKTEKRKILDNARCLIAFNWEQGWCYLSDRHLAENLVGILKSNFKEGGVKKLRQRLGLVSKHKSGPPANSP